METIYTHLLQNSPSGHIYLEHAGRHKNYPPCQSDSYMTAYIAHGSGTLIVNNSETAVDEKDVFLFNPNITYKFLPEKGIRRIDIYICHFDFDVIENSYFNFKTQFPDLENFWNKSSPFIHSVDTDALEIRDIFIRMIDEQMSDMPCSYDVIHGYLPVMLTKIFRNMKTRSFKRVYSQSRIVDEAIRHINRQMYNKISLYEISRQLKVSKSFVCREFKKHTGMTTSQFINMLRTNKIKDILRNTDKPIRAVSEMFNCNIDYLKKVFKQETGMTMQEYRDKYHYKHYPQNKKQDGVNL